MSHAIIILSVIELMLDNDKYNIVKKYLKIIEDLFEDLKFITEKSPK